MPVVRIGRRLEERKLPDGIRSSWPCAIPRCRERGAILDPDFGRPLCSDHYKGWRTVVKGWQR